MSNPTTQFLSRVMAWPRQGETPSYFNIHYKRLADAGATKVEPDGTTWYGKPGQSLNEVTRIVQYLTTAPASMGKVRDIYFCTSSQERSKTLVNHQTGRAFVVASRSSSTAVKLKSIFLDIDLTEGKKKKDKGYDTQTELVAAFRKFLVATKMPLPTIMVYTGGGYHMYWVLEQALAVPAWQELADALAEATRQNGLSCDTNCTVDAARILRVPGTKNYKYDPPRMVEMRHLLPRDYRFEEIDTPLLPYKVTRSRMVADRDMSIFPPRRGPAGTSDLAAGVFNNAPANLDTIAQGCEFVREALDTGGRDYSEPQWNLTTLIAVYSEGGVDDAKRMANGYPGYEEWKTEQKFEEKLQQGAKPPMCATVGGVYKGCQKCPYLPAGRSPVNLATLIAKPPQNAPVASLVAKSATPAKTGFGPTAPSVTAQGNQTPDLPLGYQRGADMLIRLQGDNIPILYYQMFDGYLTDDPPTLHFKTVIGTTQKEIEILCSAIANTNEFRKALQSHGIMVLLRADALMKVGFFMSAWITHLQQTPGATVSQISYGWNDHHTGFAYNGVVHLASGTQRATRGDPIIAASYKPEGDVNKWLTAAQMITAQKRPALDVILASALAGPLFALTGHSGALLSAFSPESGIGKTTAMKVAQAVWGNPLTAMQQLNDTRNSVMQKMGELRNLPIYYDELKGDSDTKEFRDLLLQITSGKEKGRIGINRQQQKFGSWQTLMVSASNHSLANLLSEIDKDTLAGVYRVLEFQVEPMAFNCPGRIDGRDADEIVSELKSNFGLVGELYASYLGSNAKAVKDRVSDRIKWVTNTMKTEQSERFWTATIATLMVGAELGNELGYFRIDIHAMVKFLGQKLLDMRQLTKRHVSNTGNAANLADILSLFLSDKTDQNTIETEYVHTKSGPPPHNIPITSLTHNLRKVEVHRGKTDKLLRINKDSLVLWLKKRDHNTSAFMKEIERKYKARTLRGKLATGTPFCTPGSFYVIEIDTTNYPDIQ